MFADNFRKHSAASSKNNRDDWNRRFDNVDEKNARSYDSGETRERPSLEAEKYRDNRYDYVYLNVFRLCDFS